MILGNVPTVIFDIVLRPVTGRIRIFVTWFVNKVVEKFLVPFVKEKTDSAGKFLQGKVGHPLLPAFDYDMVLSSLNPSGRHRFGILVG